VEVGGERKAGQGEEEPDIDGIAREGGGPAGERPVLFFCA